MFSEHRAAVGCKNKLESVIRDGSRTEWRKIQRQTCFLISRIRLARIAINSNHGVIDFCGKICAFVGKMRRYFDVNGVLFFEHRFCNRVITSRSVGNGFPPIKVAGPEIFVENAVKFYAFIYIVCFFDFRRIGKIVIPEIVFVSVSVRTSEHKNRRKNEKQR